MQQRKLQHAARKAEEAAGTAVLQLRRCCDHPQLTSFWRQLGQELQLQGAGRAGVLTIAEANARLADFEQNRLQVLCQLQDSGCVSSQQAQDMLGVVHAPLPGIMCSRYSSHTAHSLRT